MQKIKLYNLWNRIQTSFWFIPSLIMLIAFFLSFFVIGVDFYLNKYAFSGGSGKAVNRLFSLIFTLDPSGARSVLSTIAGSMITVAGVTFSITVVVLTLASSQFGPRLLRNFMEDKHTQYVLGIFSATFLYCLILLRSVHSAGDKSFIPVLGVNLSIIIAVINVFVLIYFIHHIAVSIKAEYVIKRIYTNLQEHIDRIFDNDPATEKWIYDEKAFEKIQDSEHQYETSLKVGRTGYVQAIDYDRLTKLAKDEKFQIVLELKAGDFVTASTVLMVLYSRSQMKLESDLKFELLGSFIVGAQRTPEQDVEFEFRQLSEIAVRSLSPGINDPFTAASCVDYLGAALCMLSQRGFPSSVCCDPEGNVRIYRCTASFKDIIDTAFNQIRQYAKDSAVVTMRIMEAYISIAQATGDHDIIKELIRHAGMLKRSGEEALREKEARQNLIGQYEAFLDTVNRFQ
nr:DUF2254 domain-containing protein [uncultured Desulfobacter sp.]